MEGTAPYELKHCIGSGSYGSVCDAYDTDRKEKVAIKRICNLFDDLTDCKRILREIAIMSKLKHPHLVQIYDIVKPSDMDRFDEIYVVMELCDIDLKKLCRTDVTLEPLHINTILYNLLVGLKYLHSAGIYHRDLKPANCLVNQDCSVKICDFGLSRAVGNEQLYNGQEDEEQDDMLQRARKNYAAFHRISPHDVSEKEILSSSAGLEGWAHATLNAKSADNGTPVRLHSTRIKRHLTKHVVTRWYRAPELILLQSDYSSAIDIWSVGCIYAELLEMLDGISHQERGPLFPGSTCFPLSPDRKHRHDYKFHTEGGRDQLSMIFDLLGTPSDEAIEKFGRDDSKQYVRCFSARQGHGLASKFGHVDTDLVNMLEGMLRFDPRERKSVNECLEHQIFADIREPAVEVNAPSLVTLDFDAEPELDEQQLRMHFSSEIGKYHTQMLEL